MAELTPVPVTSAGHRAPRLPAPRWLLLTCTLVGLAAMHTLGHIGPGHTVAVPERPAIHRMQATVMMLAEHAVHVAAPAREACPGGCAHLSDTLPASGHPGSWSVCLAILAAFAVAMLVGWLMRAATVHGRRQCPRCGLRVGRVLSTPAHRCVERSSYS